MTAALVRFFYVRCTAPLNGRSVRETREGLPGTFVRFANPHGSAHPFGDGKAEYTSRFKGVLSCHMPHKALPRLSLSRPN